MSCARVKARPGWRNMHSSRRNSVGVRSSSLSVDERPVPNAVDAHAEMLDDLDRLRAAFAPPLQRLQPLDQHLDAERLGDVIVGTQREADDLVGLLGLGGEHQNRNVARPFAGSQLPAHFQTVEDRQHQVEDDQVGQQRLRLRSPSWPSWATIVS